MKILTNIKSPQPLDIMGVFQYLGIEAVGINDTISLYAAIEQHKPDYLFLDDKTIIERQSLLRKYNLPTISHGMVPNEIAKVTNVKCLLGDNFTSDIPIVSIANYGNVIGFPKQPAEHLLECDIFFVLRGPLYKQLVEHVLVTTSYQIKCFSGSSQPSSASIGNLDIPQLMSLCSSAKLVFCEDAGLASVLILHDIAAIEIRIIQWDKVYEMIDNEKLRHKYIAEQKKNIRTIFDVVAEIFSILGLADLEQAALQNKRKLI